MLALGVASLPGRVGAPSRRGELTGSRTWRGRAPVLARCGPEGSQGPREFRAACVAGLAALALASPAEARLEGVNRPDLLPEGPVVSVIDVAGFLSPSQEAEISRVIAGMEKDTGVRLRVLCQNYPETPGLAVADYWKVDDDSVVFVADPSFGRGGGNILNFNVGTNLDLAIPGSFWSRLTGKYGNRFYWRENGEDFSILNAVTAIDRCAREPEAPGKCQTIVGAYDEDAKQR